MTIFAAARDGCQVFSQPPAAGAELQEISIADVRRGVGQRKINARE